MPHTADTVIGITPAFKIYRVLVGAVTFILSPLTLHLFRSDHELKRKAALRF